ncbi:uncharacterized protein LOC133178482 [Saccostrea echinata]|uniref:uncharacterized protein LOC133178482 n=1 Tax=Saccostrea echinata TaxID=191078 RepID=UPI002A82D6A4|nr:uncharacterized protein LOC133178482 [Saccostrea echinata]
MERNTSMLKCSSHELSLLPIYCEDCECPVCTKCITGCHMKHNLLDVSTYVARQKDELMASSCKDLSEKLRGELTEKKTNIEERRKQVIEEISRREDAIIAEVKDISADYRNIVDEAALQHKQKIKQIDSDLHNISKMPELKLETESDCIEELHCRSELRRIEREIKDQDSVHITFEAMKGHSKTKLKKVFGTVSVINEVTQSSDDDRTIEKKWPFDSRSIEDIFKVKERKLDKNSHPICIQFNVFGDGIPEDVYRCKGVFFSDGKSFLYLDERIFVKEMQRKVYEVVKDVQHCSDYIEHSSENGLLVITKKKSELGLLLGNGNIISIFKATKSDEKIVDVVENAKTGITVLSVKQIFNYNGFFLKSEVSLWQVNITGESKQLSYMDLKKHVNVSKICILNDTTQIVFDLDGCLSAYSQQLTFRFQYSGCRGSDPSAKFSASSVCLDSDDNILVSDKSDSTIHMLSIDGNFLKIIIWPEDNMTVMWLSVDKDGWLWIGQGGRQRTSDFSVFDFEYLKKMERKERALTEKPETQL